MSKTAELLRVPLLTALMLCSHCEYVCFWPVVYRTGLKPAHTRYGAQLMMYCWTKAIQCTKGPANGMGIYLNSWLPAKASRNNSPTVSLHFFPVILHCTMDRFVIGLNSGLVLVDLERYRTTEGGRTEEERSAGTKNTQGWWILCPLSSSGVVWCIALLDQKQLREHGQTAVSAYRLLVVAINMV